MAERYAAASCRHEERSFLQAAGELRGWSRLSAGLHRLACARCRSESARLIAASTRLRSAIGVSAMPRVSMRQIAWKTLTVAGVAVGAIGLWVIGQEAVRASAEAAKRPRLRQATFNPDDQPQRRP